MAAFINFGMDMVKTKLQEKGLDINWDDFNYPPYLKIIHYCAEDLKDAKKITIAKVATC